MSNNEKETLNEKTFLEVLLKEEVDALKNIQKPDEKLMVAKIIRLYEEAKKNDNK